MKYIALFELAGVAPEVDLSTGISFPSTKKWIRQNPLWLWNSEEMSPEIQNMGTSGPKIGHASAKKWVQNTSFTFI